MPSTPAAVSLCPIRDLDAASFKALGRCETCRQSRSLSDSTLPCGRFLRGEEMTYLENTCHGAYFNWVTQWCACTMHLQPTDIIWLHSAVKQGRLNNLHQAYKLGWLLPRNQLATSDCDDQRTARQCGASRPTCCCEGPFGAVRELDRPSWLTALPAMTTPEPAWLISTPRRNTMQASPLTYPSAAESKVLQRPSKASMPANVAQAG